MRQKKRNTPGIKKTTPAVRKSIFSDISKEVKLLLLATLFSVMGFLIVQYYFKPEDEIRGFKRQFNVDLLNNASEMYLSTDQMNDSLISYLEQRYGLRFKELDSIAERYYRKIQDIQAVNAKIKSFGNDNQIAFGKIYIENLWQVLSLISIQKNNTREFEKMSTKAYRHVVETGKRDSVENKRIMNELDSLIRSENELYFRLRDVKVPRIRYLSQWNNLLYREELGLEKTSDVEEAYQKLYELESFEKTFKYRSHKYEYLVARGRYLIAHTVDAGDSVVNSILKLDVLGRYLE